MAEAIELLAQLAALVGDLQSGPSTSEADLAEVRRLAADAVRLSPVPIASSPTVTMRAELDELAPLLSAAPARSDVMISRRELPVFSTQPSASLPAWASGRAIERTLGPFRDRLGRNVWIDVFRIVRQVRFVRTAGGAPFLSLPVTLISRLIPSPTPAATSYTLPAGSIWIASRLFAPAAPANGYTGLRIRGGRLRFTQPIVIAGDEVVVPASVHCTLELELQPESATPGSGEGADARAAQCETPATATFHIDAATATAQAFGDGRLQAYGTAAKLHRKTGAVTYIAELSRLVVPMSSDTVTFETRSVASRVFRPEGTAAIAGAGWGLPVAVIDPAHLGEASGSGNLMLFVDAGLRGSWIEQVRPVALGPVLLMVDPARLVVVALSASAQAAQQQSIDLWDGDAPNTALLRYGSQFALRFFSQAVGTELLWVGASLEARMDRPLDVKGDRLAIRGRNAQAFFLVGPQGAFVLVAAALDPPANVERVGLAIRNAVFVAAPPNILWLYVGLDPSNQHTGACALGFRQRALIPTLPDPYAANLRSLRAVLDQPSAALFSIVTWRPTKTPQLDFVIPQASGALSTPPLTAPLNLMLDPARTTGSAMLLARAAGNTEVNDGAAKALGDALAFERSRSLILLDVSTNTDQFGVAVSTAGRDDNPASRAVAVRDLYLERADVVLVTLPAVQWEALITDADPDPTFPHRLGFATSGVPSVISVPSARLVPIYPKAALDTLVDNFAAANPRPAQARFTLPFGMIASATLDKPTSSTPRGANVDYVRPKGDALEGGHQLRIRAVDPSLSSNESPSLRGFTAQLPVGQPGARSALGDMVTITFNSYLGASGYRPLVPVTRLDLSGYGESLFSDWRNPYPDPVAVSQARFDVMVGRTAHEVVQVRSYLFPYAVQVVRTITIERKNNAVVKRTDSGWQAVSDGVYAYPSSPIATHPGVVRRITKVTGIRDTGEIATIDGIQLAAVRFDGDLELDGAAELVPARDQLGYVQLTAGSLMLPATYEKLIAAAGPLGGSVDANINVGGGGQLMRARRVGVGTTQGMGGPEFVMTAWGSPAFPGGGEWSFLQLDDPALAPVAIPKDGIPLIRAGVASSGSPPPSSPYRFADPVDLAQPTNPASDYGILHATGTQRAFFPRPKIEATDPSRITSTRVPSVADPYSLATALGAFPEIPKTIPFPSATWALRIGAGGNYKLEMPATTFPVTVGRRTLRQAGSVTGDVDYTGANLTYELDTSQPVPWRFELVGARKVMNSSLMGDVITVGANVRAAADRNTTFTEPRMQLGGSMTVVQDLLTILDDIGITGVMRVAMTNEWSIGIGLTVPFKDATGEDLQIPPGDPNPQIIFADTGVEVEVKVWPDADEATFKLGGQPMFAIRSIPGLYVVAIIEFGIKLSTETGTTYSLTLGVGIAYVVEAGPFELKGLFALTFFGFIGDTTIGFGVGFLVKVSLELAIIEIALSLEGKLALVWACRGTPDETQYGVAKLTFAIEVTICFIFSISFEYETTASKVLSGTGTCPLPDVVP